MYEHCSASVLSVRMDVSRVRFNSIRTDRLGQTDKKKGDKKEIIEEEEEEGDDEEGGKGDEEEEEGK